MCEALSNLGFGVRAPSFDVSLRSRFVFAVRRSRFQVRVFKQWIINSILDLKIMFLGKFYTLNSILESILNDSGHIIQNFQKSIFRCICCTKIRPLLPAEATAGAENKMALRSILYLNFTYQRTSDSGYLIEGLRV